MSVGLSFNHIGNHRTVLEVELVNFQDDIFDCELDGETPISQIIAVKVLIKYESKVAQAANKIMKLPVMPHRQYSIVLSSPLALDFAPNCCMGSSWSRALPPKTAERNFEAELTKCSEFQLGFR